MMAAKHNPAVDTSAVAFRSTFRQTSQSKVMNQHFEHFRSRSESTSGQVPVTLWVSLFREAHCYTLA